MDEESEKKQYGVILKSFIKEVKNLKNPSFVNIDNWVLDDGLLNGVLIGYSINSESDRFLIHKIGLKYGLLPLCPEDVVDLDFSTDEMRSVVATRFGKYTIKSKNSPRPLLH